MRIPKKVSDRLVASTKNFQKVLVSARDRDVNESDTVTIVTDMLGDVFGFDKYTEITGELAIRSTYCDLAVRLGDSVELLIEVKAVGLALKESHLRQVIDYGANHGIQWVVLTNGIHWEIYRLKFERPIGFDCVLSFNFLDLNARKAEDQKKLYLLCKEGLVKSAMEMFHEHVQAVNRFVIGAILTTDPVIQIVRRELKKMTPDITVAKEEIEAIIASEVLKREIVEGDAAEVAAASVKKASKATLRQRAKSSEPSAAPPAPATPVAETTEPPGLDGDG
jgi:predicted type IV restriction endonuclease